MHWRKSLFLFYPHPGLVFFSMTDGCMSITRLVLSVPGYLIYTAGSLIR